TLLGPEERHPVTHAKLREIHQARFYCRRATVERGVNHSVSLRRYPSLMLAGNEIAGRAPGSPDLRRRGRRRARELHRLIVLMLLMSIVVLTVTFCAVVDYVLPSAGQPPE